MAEAGLPDYEISFWYGFFVPAGTPPEVTRTLFTPRPARRSARRASAQVLARDGTETVGLGFAGRLRRLPREEATLWARLVKEVGRKGRLIRSAGRESVSMSPPLFMQVVNSSSANFWLDGAAGRRALLLLRAVGGVGDVAHQLLAAIGIGHVVDAHHDGVRLRAAGSAPARASARPRPCPRRRRIPARFRRAAPHARCRRQGSASEERCQDRFQVHLQKRGARFPGRRVIYRLLRFARAAAEPLVAGVARGRGARGGLARSRGGAGLAAGSGRRRTRRSGGGAAGSPRRYGGTHPIRRARSMPSPFLSMAEKSGEPWPLLGWTRRPPNCCASRPCGRLARRPCAGWLRRPWARCPCCSRPRRGAACVAARGRALGENELVTAADTCAAKGRANAPATATTSNFLKFIQSPG